MIETMRFRLSPGSPPRRPSGRPTVASSPSSPINSRGCCAGPRPAGVDGDWIVIDLWRSEADADAATERWADDPAAAHFMSFVDRATLQVDRLHHPRLIGLRYCWTSTRGIPSGSSTAARVGPPGTSNGSATIRPPSATAMANEAWRSRTWT